MQSRARWDARTAEVRAENLVPAEAMPYTNVAGKFYDTGDYQRASTKPPA